jgi:hypothetical protein
MKFLTCVETLPVAVMRKAASSEPSVPFMRTSMRGCAPVPVARDATRNGLMPHLTALHLWTAKP